jgi:transposase-like protein
MMNNFKWKYFKGDIILGCERWYCKYGISFRDLEEMMLERGIEADHGILKRLIKPTLGFKSLKTAFATINGFEVMRIFKKGQFDIWKYDQGLTGEIRLIERQFRVYSAA